MSDYSDLLRFADGSLLEQAKRLLERSALTVSAPRCEADGTVHLRGRCTDAFNFVDHPSLVLRPDGSVANYRCECADGRTGRLCVHCAALALKDAETRPRVQHTEAPGPEPAAGIPEEPETPGAPEPEAPEEDAAVVWEDAGPASEEIRRYSFRFGNNRWDLYHTRGTVYLNLENFYAMLGRNQIVNTIYEKRKEFGGICYGMAAANSIMNWPPDKMPPSDFQPEAELPYDLPLNCSCRELGLRLLDILERLYIVQMIPKVDNGRVWLDNAPSADAFIRELCGKINSYREGKNALCNLGIRQFENGDFRGGHALLPYRADEDERGPWRIALYDCNYPGKERYMNLERDPDGRIVGWAYQMGDQIWGKDGKGFTYGMNYTEHDLYFDAFKDRHSPFPADQGLLITGNQITLLDAENVAALRYTPGKGYETDRKDVLISYPLTLESSAPFVYMPAGRYSAEVTEAEPKEIALTFSSIDRSAEIRCDAVRFDFEVNDEGQICVVEIPEAERSYYVHLRSTDPEDQQDVRLEGVTGPGGLRFGQIDHTLCAEGIGEETQQYLFLNGLETGLDVLQMGFPQRRRELLYNAPGEPGDGEEPSGELAVPGPVQHAAVTAVPALKRADHGQGEICQYSFSFYNSTQDLYPNGETPVLSLESFTAVLGRNRIALEYYAFASVFGGICYGMAAANSMFNWPQDGIRPADFRPGAVRPYDLPLNSYHPRWRMGLHEYLDQLFITQMHPLIETRTRESSESLDSFIRELCGRINGYREGKNPLCIVGVSRQRGAGEDFEYEGHELLPFRVDEEPGKSLRIAVYDCNHEGEEQYIEMELDPQGRIVDWRYDMGSYGVWSHNGKGYKHDLDYVEHDQFHRFFVDRPVPIPGDLGLFMTKNKLILRNAANEEVLHINEEEGYRSLSDQVKIRIPKALKGARPIIYAPAGEYSVDVWETEMTESTVTFATGKRSVEIRTDADRYSFEVNDEGDICTATIPQVESTYYITIKSLDELDHKEVRLEGVTGYEPLRFGVIAHTLYVEGISEKSQQDLYLEGKEAPMDIVKVGFPETEKAGDAQEETERQRPLLYNGMGGSAPQDKPGDGE